MLATIWDDPKNVDTLTSMWRDGASASEIARVIPGATRASVIGKVHRLKLAKRSTVAVNTQRRESSNPSKKPHRNAGQVTAKGIVSRVAARREAANSNGGLAFKLSEACKQGLSDDEAMQFVLGKSVALPGEGVDVTHLVGMKFEEAVDSHGCLWCDGDPLTANHAFCGKRRKPGHRWCPEHYVRVYSGKGALI